MFGYCRASMAVCLRHPRDSLMGVMCRLAEFGCSFFQRHNTTAKCSVLVLICGKVFFAPKAHCLRQTCFLGAWAGLKHSNYVEWVNHTTLAETCRRVWVGDALLLNTTKLFDRLPDCTSQLLPE